MICARSYSNSIVQSCSLIVWEQVRYHLLNLHVTSSCLWIHKQLSYTARTVITAQRRERDRVREELRPFEPTNQPTSQPACPVSVRPHPPASACVPFPFSVRYHPQPHLSRSRFGTTPQLWWGRLSVRWSCRLWSSGRGCNRLSTNHVHSSTSSAPIGRRQCSLVPRLKTGRGFRA